MGLDMYVHRVKAKYLEDQPDVNMHKETIGQLFDDGKTSDLWYWRKHHDLHGWMGRLYVSKGGEGDFNCQYMRLTAEDIALLRIAVTNETLPPTKGFFFGDNPPDDSTKVDDLRFCDAAKEALEAGNTVLYFAWW